MLHSVMRILWCAALCLSLGGWTARAADPEEKAVLAAIQNLFDGMAAHDAVKIKSAMTPEARLVAARDTKPAAIVTRDEFAQSIASNPGSLRERIWEPKIMIHGPIAMLWAPYDFHLNGKFHHCGIDTFLMLKTEEGWKASALSYTSETEHCTPSPLGPL